MFLAWYDPRPGITTERRIADALERYEEKFGQVPKVVLVNPDDAAPVDGVEVIAARHVARHTVYVGDEGPHPLRGSASACEGTVG